MEVTAQDKEGRGTSNILRKESCGEQGIMKDEVGAEARRQRAKNGKDTTGTYCFGADCCRLILEDWRRHNE